MLSNAYFLAKVRFDTAENEPAKNLQKFAKFANFAPSPPDPRPRRVGARPEEAAQDAEAARSEAHAAVTEVRRPPRIDRFAAEVHFS